MYKLLVSAFDTVARLATGVTDAFSDGRKLARLLTVVGVLLSGAALTGTFAVEGPEPSSEDAAGQVLWLPGNVQSVTSTSGESIATVEPGQTLRLRFPAEAYLGVDEDTLKLSAGEQDVPWDPRERGDGISVLTRGPQPSGTRLDMVLDDELAAQGVPEIHSTSTGMDHVIAMVGVGLAILIFVLLIARQERVAVWVGVAVLLLAIGTRTAWFDAKSEAPVPTEVSSETPESDAEATPTEAPDEPEAELDLSGDDWLQDLENELVADGTLTAEEVAVEAEPAAEAEADDAGLDWLNDLEAELEADGKLPAEAAEVPEASADPDLGDDLDWLLELEAELEGSDAPDAAPEAAVQLELPDTLVTLTPKSAFWVWAVGLLLAFIGSLSGYISTLDEGADRAKVAVILTATGIWIAFEEIAERVDRVIEWLERATIAVFLLVMTLLSFADYVRREIDFLNFEIEGGPNMATLMMVWVGFLGASLATRTGQHLSVDATDRILSPGAAKLAKRFTALVAAGLCWTLMEHSWTLTAENLEKGDTVPGLYVWDFLIAPLNALVAFLPGSGSLAWVALVIGGPIAWLALGRAMRIDEEDTTRAGRLVRPAWMAVAGITGGAALLGALPLFWTPELENGGVVEWGTFASGDAFPLWIGAIVIPLAFGLMSLRFLVAAVLGRFKKQELGGEVAIEKPFEGGQRTRKDMVLAAFFPGVLIGLGATLYFGTGGLILLTGLLLVFVGAPLFVAIGIATLACVVLIDDLSGYYVAKDMFEATKKEELLAIPFFVLAGNIMTQGSLAERMIGVARAVMGRMPGGLGLATVSACVVFAAISGSSPVTVIAIGGLMYPMLTADGYSKSYATGVLSSAGSLGIIIPPSIPMILYAIVVSDPRNPMSPNDLFLAGVGPGLLIAVVLMLYTLYRTRPTGEGVNIVVPKLEGGYVKNLGRALKKGLLALMLPVIILGGIYGIFAPFGIRFTVTEAAAVAVVYALVVEMFIHRELTVRKLVDVLVESGVMMGSLFVIIVLAIAFNKFLAHQEVPQRATEWLAMHVDSKIQFLIMVNLFLLALGCVMEIISAILIVAPLLAPIAASYGIHPIHFGIIFIVNLELGYLTPPMGINLFVASTVFERPIVKVIRSVIPFLLLMLTCLVIIAWFEPLSTFLVNLTEAAG